MGLLNVHMKIVHRLEVLGTEKIPTTGSIMYLNHTRENDAIYLLAALKKPVSIFTAVGNGFIADYLEHVFGFVTRHGARNEMVEKIVRTILLKNQLFAIWPEGNLSPDGRPMESFSGIIRVYAILNSRGNVIPFQPILMRGAETNVHCNDRRKRKIPEDTESQKIMGNRRGK